MSDLNQQLGMAMRQVFAVRGVLDPSHAVPALGVTLSQAMSLWHLSHGPTTQGELAAALGLEKSTVSRLVDGLVNQGWLRKEPDPLNRRCRRLDLTAAGRRAAGEVLEAMQQRHALMLGQLSKAERDALAVALPALLRVLTGLDRPRPGGDVSG